MFDGPTSEGLDLDAPLVVLDLSAVRDSAALGILMTCAAAWQQAILLERKQAAEQEGRESPKLISVVEEGWRVTSHIGVAEWLQANFKLCRALGVHRPRLAIVIAIVISIAGVIALGALPVAQFPDIVPPQVGVSATYPGASAAAVEESVAQVIESQVNGVDKMIYMKSTSGGDGSYSLNVTFQVGSDPDLNTVNVTNRVNQALAQLPPEVSRNGVTTKKASTSLLQVVAIYSPKGSRDALFLSNYAKINIVDTLKRVPGVGDAGQWGDLEYSMRIWLNLDRMASLDITPEDVVNAINSQNTQAAVGRVGAAPLVPEVEFQLNISTQGRLTTVEEFNNIIVRATPDGGVVRIKDIARTELGSKSAELPRFVIMGGPARRSTSTSRPGPMPWRSPPASEKR